MKNKSLTNMKSEELLARFMRGDSRITIRMIEKAENTEEFNYYLKKWSFENQMLESIVILPVTCFLIVKLDPILFIGMGFVIISLLK